MSGRRLWMRTISSTVIGSVIDNGGFFVLLGLYFDLSWQEITTTAFTAIIFQICYEALATPVTYRIIGFLKHHEGIDTYDVHTNFNPFSLKTDDCLVDLHRHS